MSRSEKQNVEGGETTPTGKAPGDGGSAMRLRISDKQAVPCYTNAFRSNASSEEVILDFGMDLITRAPQPDSDDVDARTGEIVFVVSHRMVMSYYTAKRLAIVLGQLINKHETQFGDIKLNAADRARSAAA